VEIISCNCLNKVGASLTYNKDEDTYDLEIESTVVLEDGTGCYQSKDKIESIRYCPFCGKKIEVKDDR